ncbi:MAG TPA: MBL fold metallo-hydrolase [Devosiaceae bacterium]|jgi:L-ascorbate metabolism protein UlaG (beta-lactamase superfamily)
MIQSDTVKTPDGDIVIQPINHASLVLRFGTLTVYCDPVGNPDLYKALPRPDLILITHEHGDHLNAETLAALVAADTAIIGAKLALSQLQGDLAARSTVIAQGETQTFKGLRIEAIPAHNLAEERQKFHPKGVGNGYILSLGGKRLYVSGDTEDVPEMLALKDIDVAFLPMNLPYTMTGKQAADATRIFRPRIVYPFHYLDGGEEKVFAEALKGEVGIEVRQRDWYAKD